MKTRHGNFPRHSSAWTEKGAHFLGVPVAPTWLDASCSGKTNHPRAHPASNASMHACDCYDCDRLKRGNGVQNVSVKKTLLPKRLQMLPQAQFN